MEGFLVPDLGEHDSDLPPAIHRRGGADRKDSARGLPLRPLFRILVRFGNIYAVDAHRHGSISEPMGQKGLARTGPEPVPVHHPS